MTTSTERQSLRALFHGCLWQHIGGKTICPFSKKFYRLRKSLYSLFEIPSNLIFLKKSLLQTLNSMIIRKVSNMGELLFYKKYLDRDRVDKWA